MTSNTKYSRRLSGRFDLLFAWFLKTSNSIIFCGISGTCSPGLAISRCATILGSGLVTYSLNYSCPSASICGHTGIVLYSIGFVNSVVFPPLGLGHRYITFLGCTEVSFVCLFSSSACTVCTVRLHTAIGVTSSIRYKWIENGKSWWKVCKYFVLFDSRDRRRGVYHVVDVATLRFPCTSFGQKSEPDLAFC